MSRDSPNRAISRDYEKRIKEHFSRPRLTGSDCPIHRIEIRDREAKAT